MLTLHGFGPNFNLVDASPFVIKVDCYLRMANIEYKLDNSPGNLKDSPTGKLPYIIEDNEMIADSQSIIAHLIEKYGDMLDVTLTASQKAESYLITKSLDENLYFGLVYSRWLCDDTWPTVKHKFFGSLPPVLRTLVPALVRKSVVKTLKGQGITRHSHDEIIDICRQSFQALSDRLEGKTYAYGSEPSTLDAACFGHLAGFVVSDLDNPFNRLARTFPVLVDYCRNIQHSYYQ